MRQELRVRAAEPMAAHCHGGHGAADCDRRDSESDRDDAGSECLPRRRAASDPSALPSYLEPRRLAALVCSLGRGGPSESAESECSQSRRLPDVFFADPMSAVSAPL
jgi:hypothetical protein